MRWILRSLLVVAGVFMLTGCGGYYYRASIQGFVIDGETEAGVNEAIVRIYTDETDDPESEDYVTQTSTVTQNGNGGYYSSTVIWQKLFGAYGQEGDTTTLWIAVIHPDYAPVIFQAEGILSDVDNLVASIRLSQTTYDRPALRGRVVDSTGTGVNGVRVVLDLPVVSGSDDPEDDVTQTATIDGEAGTFEFAPVEWSELNTTDTDGEITITLRIDDPDWGADVSALPSPLPEDYLVEMSVSLIPGDATRIVPSDIEVYRRPRTEFSTTVTGRLLERIVDAGGNFVEDRPVGGVRVQLDYDFEGLPFETLVDRTDATGTYTFVVSWTDLQPGDFDDAGDIPPAGNTDGIAPGEDGLLVDISYEDVDGGSSTLFLKFSEADRADYEIYSRPSGAEIRVQDVIRTASP
jgi:hypothetical protein